jgi:[ribosomal protein S5]-alanine N-acetyltransferase
VSSHPGWPATLTAGPVLLRPPRYRDAAAWSELRLRNEQWLREWEPSSPYSWAERSARSAWPPLHAALRRAGRQGSMLPFMITYGGRLVGQVNASNVVRGVLRSCSIGYWLDAAVAGRGIVPTAVALLVDHCFAAAGLHRVQIDVRPENVASLRVVAKLGLRQEGRLERFLDINGAWRDHLSFAITVEELGGGTLLGRLGGLPRPPDGVGS